MENGIDSVGIDRNPVQEHTLAMALLFMVIVFVGSFFLVNLLVAVVHDNFSLETSIERGEAFLTPDQREYVLQHAYMLNVKLLRVKHVPKN
jgi:hypothetical protein